jgi:hypothetical protein
MEGLDKVRGEHEAGSRVAYGYTWETLRTIFCASDEWMGNIKGTIQSAEIVNRGISVSRRIEEGDEGEIADFTAWVTYDKKVVMKEKEGGCMNTKNK